MGEPHTPCYSLVIVYSCFGIVYLVLYYWRKCILSSFHLYTIAILQSVFDSSRVYISDVLSSTCIGYTVIKSTDFSSCVFLVFLQQRRQKHGRCASLVFLYGGWYLILVFPDTRPGFSKYSDCWYDCPPDGVWGCSPGLAFPGARNPG